MTQVKCVRRHVNALIPKSQTSGSAGYDLHSCEEKIIKARGMGTVNIGISLEFSPYLYARVAPRSGLACKNGISVGAGVVDSDFRGILQVILFNHSDSDFKINIGDRIAQLIFERISKPMFIECDLYDLKNDTERGDGGFGSTGLNV